MKPLGIEEIRAMATEDLVMQVRLLKKELFEIRMKLAVGQYSQVADVKAIKKGIARIMTVLNQRRNENV